MGQVPDEVPLTETSDLVEVNFEFVHSIYRYIRSISNEIRDEEVIIRLACSRPIFQGILHDVEPLLR